MFDNYYLFDFLFNSIFLRKNVNKYIISFYILILFWHIHKIWGFSCKHKVYGVFEELATGTGYVCNRLLSSGEDGFGTRWMTSFCKLFGRHKDLEGKFS